MDYDVVIVGSGPSGSTCARICAKRGLHTLLVEKEHHPRYKPCGGGLTLRILRALDFEVPEDVIERRVGEMRLFHGNEYMSYKNSDKRDPLITMVDRSRFDDLLAGKAVEEGVEMREGTAVSSVSISDDSCQVVVGGETVITPIVVGADGVNSIVSKHVRPRFRSNDVSLTFEAEVMVGESEVMGRGGFAESYLDLDVWGYGWVFPKKDHLSVGFGGLLDKMSDPRKHFAKYLKRLGLEKQEMQVHAHLIPVGSDKRPVVADRTILVGDAAGFAEPFTGEGIYYAIRSGQIAADSITRSYERSDFSIACLESYSRICLEEFGHEFRRANKAMRAFFTMKPLSVRILFSDQAFMEHFARIQTGRETYKQFKRWMLPRSPYYLVKGLLRM
ncbi:geranylgeranyl reductase family protein [Candidatus Altiarchaeota archaeon]